MKERRKYPRIKDRGVSVRIDNDEYSTVTQSLDISANGIYCKVTERIPVMTRVRISLVLPEEKSPKGSTTLDVSGVVVREHPVVKDGRPENYDVAIFFDELAPEDREKLVKYIESRS